MYPGFFAKMTPAKPAVIMAGSGQVISYRQLNDRSNQCARMLRSLGLDMGDCVAIFMENHPRFFELVWAAQRAGLYYTPISTHLTTSEVENIVRDCGAKVLFSSYEKRQVAAQLLDKISTVQHHFMLTKTISGYESYEKKVTTYSTEPIADEVEGSGMLYSSGTTGRPKGVKRPLLGVPMGEERPDIREIMTVPYGMNADTVYLSPAPLYHAAPLYANLRIQRLGGTSIIMERFDAEQSLALIEKYKVTHSQWVPTMFVRMLRLPEMVRQKYDLASMSVAIHGAAPCPIPIKEKMIAWWGPILYEYYASTESIGFTLITSPEWLERKGSVGRSLRGPIHILDDAGNEVPAGRPGTIYFESGASFEYHNDPEKTAQVFNAKGWSTLGDIGYLDEAGFLYLTDRKSNMIISGGVNIYPQEAENVLATHPKVADVAVFGIPNLEFGEEVKAAIQLFDLSDAGPELEQELIGFCRQRLAKLKCPRSIDFHRQFPRTPTGKLFKRLLRDEYWIGRNSRII